MPWQASDAEGHTKLANTKKRREVWAQIANNILRQTADEGRAIREANSAMQHLHKTGQGK
jgi:hypothetical protein